MPFSRRATLGTMALAVAGFTSLVASPSALAQEHFPSRPVTLVVPYPPGGTPDTFVRRMAELLKNHLGQPVVVENRPGAASTIGMQYVARAKPDGYTLVYATSGGLASAPALIAKLPYDPTKDFAGVTLTNASYFALLVKAQAQPVSATQWLERARAAGGATSISGTGATNQTLVSMIAREGKLAPTYVPYQSSVGALTDLYGDRLSAMAETLFLSRAQVAGGKGQILAVSSPVRLKTIPDVPTLQELIPGVTMEVWTGFFAPAQTPKPVLATLHKAMREAMKDPELVRMAEDGGRVLDSTPDETDAFVRSEVPRWSKLIKAAGIEPQ